MHQTIRAVTRQGQLSHAVIFLGIRLSVLHHTLNFFFGQTRVRLDGDLVLFARAFIFGRDVNNTVRINIKRHFNLRCAAW